MFVFFFRRGESLVQEVSPLESSACLRAEAVCIRRRGVTKKIVKKKNVWKRNNKHASQTVSVAEGKLRARADEERRKIMTRSCGMASVARTAREEEKKIIGQWGGGGQEKKKNS